MKWVLRVVALIASGVILWVALAPMASLSPEYLRLPALAVVAVLVGLANWPVWLLTERRRPRRKVRR